MEVLRKVRPGDEITADQFNAMVDAIHSMRLMAAAPLYVSRVMGGQVVGIHGLLQIGLFELQGTLAAGGDATAYRMRYDGSAWAADSGESVTVYDSVGGSQGGTTGQRCWCLFSSESGHWEVLVVEC